MKILQILTLGLYKPFTHDPKDFRLKIAPAWFGDDWVKIKYSANGGKWYNTIHHAEYDILKERFCWEPLYVKVWSSTSRAELFTSYQSILDYEKDQWEHGTSRNKENEENDKRRAEEKRNIFKTFNEKH